MKNNSFSKDFINFILSMFYPKRCIFCDEVVAPFDHICKECEDTLPKINGEICNLCGVLKSDCNCKGRHSNFYDGIAAPLYYEADVKRCIHSFKFYDNRLNADGLAELMTQTLNEVYADIDFDYITYIPMRKSNLKKRGYNQSRLLAQRVSIKSGIPLADEMLVKIYDTASQRGTSELERKGNVAGVFDVNTDKYDLEHKNVLLIDDVKTTGTTLSECGKMLYLSGADKVYCLTAAVVKSKIKENKSKEG